MTPDQFRKFLYQKGREYWRDMPWRSDTRPYHVLVSELMLQQTQVTRVVPKFEAFIERFPDLESLAESDLDTVLKLWQGLGYNRRAKYLHDTARVIKTDFGGVFPRQIEDMMKLPGVGRNTAGAIAAYSYNRPDIFIETNIRTVYIYHFFTDVSDVSDTEIGEKLSETIDKEHPRRFYQAIMDYGSWLKASGVRTNTKSRHYKKQSALKGSVRQVRGQIITALIKEPLNNRQLRSRISGDSRYKLALQGLIRDGLIIEEGGIVRLTK